MFIVQNIHTKKYVSDVSRINFQIEKIEDEREARIFRSNWYPFWISFIDYEIIHIDDPEDK